MTIIPFIRTYPRTFNEADMRCAGLTSRGDRNHIISRDSEHNFVSNATVLPVHLNISIASQNRYRLKESV